MEGELTFEAGIQKVDSYLDDLLNFLETQQRLSNAKMFIASYTAILRLSDEQDKSAELYDIYQDRIRHFIKKVFEPKIQKKCNDSREFLEEYCNQWKKFTLFIFTLKKLFDYLDRYYLKNAGQ